MPKEITRVDAVDLLALLAVPPDSDGTDERILATVAELLRLHGLSGLEVDEVAARSGIGRSTIYRRFGDRNALITASLAREGRRLLTVLAAAVADVDDVVEEVTAAFCTGLRVARASGLAALVREDPLLLRLLTIDGGPVIAAASDQLADLGVRRVPGVDRDRARRTAELLVRLAVSFVVAPDSALDLDDDAEGALRPYVAALVAPQAS